MYEYFIETLSISYEWVRADIKPYNSWIDANFAAADQGITDESNFYRIVAELNKNSVPQRV